MAEKREPREIESRDAEKRHEEWRPPSALPVPAPRDGYVFRWVRTAIGNEADKTNVSKRFQERWAPVDRKDHPEVDTFLDPFSQSGATSGTIEFGGLILCKMPIEVARQRDAYYLRLALGQIDAVDNTIFKTEDRRMPVLPAERRTRISTRIND